MIITFLFTTFFEEVERATMKSGLAAILESIFEREKHKTRTDVRKIDRKIRKVLIEIETFDLTEL
jgi:hypothetical protein